MIILYRSWKKIVKVLGWALFSCLARSAQKGFLILSWTRRAHLKGLRDLRSSVGKWAYWLSILHSLSWQRHSELELLLWWPIPICSSTGLPSPLSGPILTLALVGTFYTAKHMRPQLILEGLVSELFTISLWGSRGKIGKLGVASAIYIFILDGIFLTDMAIFPYHLLTYTQVNRIRTFNYYIVSACITLPRRSICVFLLIFKLSWGTQ